MLDDDVVAAWVLQALVWNEKRKPIYWVITGNHQEYVEYIRHITDIHPERLEQYDYRYVRHVDIIRGQRNMRGSFIGTWYNREDARIIYGIISASHIGYAENTYNPGLFTARKVLDRYGKPVGAVGA
jgi:hypothetical protein